MLNITVYCLLTSTLKELWRTAYERAHAHTRVSVEVSNDLQ